MKDGSESMLLKRCLRSLGLRPSKTWMDRFVIHGVPCPLAWYLTRHVRANSRRVLSNMGLTTEQDLKKTGFERETLHECLASICRVRWSFGHGRLKVPERGVHVVTRDAFREAVGGNSVAITVGRQVILPRADRSDRKDVMHFVWSMLHELNHLSQYSEMIIEVEYGTMKTNVVSQRGGFRIGSERVGLNEAATDIVSGICANYLTESEWFRREMPGVNADELRINTMGYVVHVSVLARICDEVARRGGPSVGEMIVLVVNDYLSGTERFMEELRRHYPEAEGPLSEMGPKNEDAMETAKSLDLVMFDE